MVEAMKISIYDLTQETTVWNRTLNKFKILEWRKCTKKESERRRDSTKTNDFKNTGRKYKQELVIVYASWSAEVYVELSNLTMIKKMIYLC